MKNQLQVTVNEIVKLNHGSWDDAQEIINRYVSVGKLSRIENDCFSGYISKSLTKEDLILKSTFEYVFVQVKKWLNTIMFWRK